MKWHIYQYFFFKSKTANLVEEDLLSSRCLKNVIRKICAEVCDVCLAQFNVEWLIWVALFPEWGSFFPLWLFLVICSGEQKDYISLCMIVTFKLLGSAGLCPITLFKTEDSKSDLYASGANMWTCQTQWMSRGGENRRSSSVSLLLLRMKGIQKDSYLGRRIQILFKNIIVFTSELLF